MSLYDEGFVDRFWRRVSKGDECWLWTAYKSGGYGVLCCGRRGLNRRAHRVAWEITNGPIPEGLYVCHSCDNPSCVRPAHLFLGTQSHNMSDMWRKERRPRKLATPRQLKTHCKYGHSLGDAIVGRNQQGYRRRACRVCSRAACRAWAAKNRAARKSQQAEVAQ